MDSPTARPRPRSRTPPTRTPPDRVTNSDLRARFASGHSSKSDANPSPPTGLKGLIEKVKSQLSDDGGAAWFAAGKGEVLPAFGCFADPGRQPSASDVEEVCDLLEAFVEAHFLFLGPLGVTKADTYGNVDVEPDRDQRRAKLLKLFSSPLCAAAPSQPMVLLPYLCTLTTDVPQVCGFMEVYIKSATEDAAYPVPHIYIHHLMVGEQQRRCKVASLLFLALLNRCQLSDLHDFALWTLYVHGKNEPAIALYDSAGFVIADERKKGRAVWQCWTLDLKKVDSRSGLPGLEGLNRWISMNLRGCAFEPKILY